MASHFRPFLYGSSLSAYPLFHRPFPNKHEDAAPATTLSWLTFRPAIYHSVHHKPDEQPQLIVKGTPRGNYDFLAQAWQAANNKARELGWIV
jgi:hypothetical protein